MGGRNPCYIMLCSMTSSYLYCVSQCNEYPIYIIMILNHNDRFFQFREKPFSDVNKSLYACEEFVNIHQLDTIGVLLLLLLLYIPAIQHRDGVLDSMRCKTSPCGRWNCGPCIKGGKGVGMLWPANMTCMLYMSSDLTYGVQ
jgi:hypothetical protein